MKKKEVAKLLGNLLVLCIILGIILYVVQNSLEDIFRQLISTNPRTLVLVTAIGSLYIIVEGRNIANIASCFVARFKARDGSFAICYAAFYRLITFGTGTIVSEVLFYRRKGATTSQGVGISAVHMILQKLAVVFMGFLGLICFALASPKELKPVVVVGTLIAAIATSLLIAFLLLLSSNEKLHAALIKWASRHIKKASWWERIDKVNQHIYSLRETVQRIMRDRQLFVRLLLLNMGKLLIWYTIPFVVLSESHQVSFFLPFSLIATVSVLAGIIPAPAGIGSLEFFYMLFFKPFFGTVDSAASLLLYRFATYVLPFFIGLCYTAFSKRRQLSDEFHELKKNYSE